MTARVLIHSIVLIPLIAVARPKLLSQTDGANVSGTWDLSLESAAGSATPTITLSQEGEKITGTYIVKLGKTSLKGTLERKNIKIIVTFKFLGQQVSVTYSGEVDDDAMKGSVQFSIGGSGSWTAHRKKQNSASSSGSRKTPEKSQ
ncbi:MAG TPA: hypothetical protein VE398_03975 [Acidobacteriota bacterium]|nr:hypothetical protein [Acidobacteriota bacterium]